MAAEEAAVVEAPINAWAAREKGGELSPWSYTPEPLGAAEVEIAIKHCGVCFTDCDLVDDTFGWSSYPMVPGHEIVGEVTQVGGSVRSLAIGDVVGVGPQRNCCFQCTDCLAGHENRCAHRHDVPSEATYGTAQPIFRGFADRLRVNCNFAFKLPDGLDPVSAGPLMCAGVTVWEPLHTHASPGARVGVLGIGGLGHLALQFASKMGCEAVAISRSRAKEAAARGFGATDFIATDDDDDLKAHEGTLDIIVSTATAPLDWPPLLRLLRNGGKVCVVGACGESIDGIPTLLLMMNHLSLIGSAMASRKNVADMLAFAARHGVAPQVDSVVPFAAVNAALARVRAGRARFRVILSHDESAHRAAPEE